MGLNQDLIRQKLKQAQTKGNTVYEKTDYTKVYFKPTSDTTYSVRIVPYKYDKDFPISELEMHNYNTFKKFVPTRSNFGE